MFFVGLCLSAVRTDDFPTAYVIFADGEGFALIRNGKEFEYDVYLDDVFGLDFYIGDFIQTGNNTFLELQLIPSRNVLKISENTSFQIKRLDEKGNGTFDIVYGRIRARVSKLAGSDEFSISGPSIAAGVRGTDFGYDIIADPSTPDENLTQIYCFEGSVVLSAAETDEEVVVEKDQMVEVAESTAGLSSVKPVELKQEIKNFWMENNFEGDVIETGLPFIESLEIHPEDIPEVSGPDLLAAKRSGIVKQSTAVLAAGLVLESAGIVLYLSAPFILPVYAVDVKEGIGTGIMISGGIFISAALFGYLSTLNLK